jgi:Pyruvate:ferredoxin oxidoreductase and related 2-oxoacid:ferredoxin oxidoreductases, gamma subunit
MGVPVSGKNLFPSNIQGLPTWFTIRASKDGYIARKRDLDVLVCMNPETADDDVREVRAGAHVVCEKKLGLENPGKKRDDVTYYAVPFSELVVKIASAPEHAKLRKLIVNMIYVGVVADLMGIDPVEVEKAIAKQLKGKQKAIDLNINAMRLGLEFAAQNFPAKIPFRVERMNATQGKIMVEGNMAAALGCVFGGATVCAWYPITPSSSLCESFIDFCDDLRVDRSRRRRTSRSSRPRTSSPLSAWCSAPDGRAPARSPPRPDPASRSCPSTSASVTTPRSRRSCSTSSAPGRPPGSRRARCRETSSSATSTRRATRSIRSSSPPPLKSASRWLRRPSTSPSSSRRRSSS